MRRILLRVLVAGAVVGAACGGTLKVELICASRLREGRVTVQVTLVNTGDTALESIRPCVAHPGQPRLEGSLLDRLEPGERETWALEPGLPPGPPGIHTLVVTARYTDQHGHPFTSLDTVPVYTGDPDPGTRITGKLTCTPLDGRGEATLTLDADAPTEVRVHLAVPDELEGIPLEPTATFALQPGAPQQVAYALRNRWAVPGSSYRVFAVVSEEANGETRSRVVPGFVRVAMPPALPETAWRRAWIVPALLLLAFIASQWLPRRRAPG